MGKHLAAPQLDSKPPVSSNTLLRRVALIVGLVLLGIGSALAGYAIFEHKNPFQAISNVFIPSPDQVFGKPNLLVLVEGLDYDYNEKDEEYSTQARSDVIKAVNLDFGTKQVYVLSVLRDMAVVMPSGHEAKINEAQSDGGTPLAEKVISQFLGIPGFDRYIVVRINTAKDLINAVGGIDVNVQNSDPKDKSPINYDDSWGHLHIHLKPGMQHLTGETAVGYMRFRHDWCGDPCRSKRQDQVIKALVDKLKGDKLNTLMHANDLVGVFRRDVTTNLSQGEMISLANYFMGLSPGDLHTAQVPYVGDKIIADGGDALIPDDAGKTRLVQSMLIAPPSPEPSPDAMALAGVTPASVRIDIENGSGIEGAAHKVADALKAAGFTIGEVGDAQTDDHAVSEIHEHSHVSFAGAKVRAALPRIAAVPVVNDGDPTAAPSASAVSDVTLIVGKDLAQSLLARQPLATSTP